MTTTELVQRTTDAPTRGQRTALLDRDTLGGRALTFVASTAGVKRDGIDLRLDGGDFANYEANPVFLWAHDYSGSTLPIGKVTKIRKLKSRIDVEVEFDQDDPFAQRVEKKYRDGYLNAVSIGWDVLEWERGDDGDGFIVTAWDLLDVSAVPVPGDPSALMKTQRALLGEIGRELLDASVQDSAEPVAPVVQDSKPPEVAPLPDTLVDSVQRAVDAIDALTERIEAATPTVAGEGEVMDTGVLEAIHEALSKEPGDA